MRSIWKGAVSFGLVSIGVKLYAATEEKGISFNQVRRSDGSRIRYKRVAEADGEEVPYADIAKGYPISDGDVVILTDEDFADLPLVTNKVVDVLQFVPADEIDPIYFSKSYYLEPEKTAVKPYVLLREALETSGMVGLVKVALRNREQLATLRVRDGVIVLETMLWPDEIRTPDFAFLDQDVELRPQEKSMAESLVTSMAGDFEPDQYHDQYREALQAVIDAKVEGRQVTEAPTAGAPEQGNVVDLMAALRASVEAAKAKRGESPAVAPVGDDSGGDSAAAVAEGEPAEQAPRRRAPARSSAAKKAPAKAAAASGRAPASKASTSSAKATTTAPGKAATKTATKTAAKTATKTAAKTVKSAAKSPAKSAAAKAPAKKEAAGRRRTA